jgi:iron complex transport system permease protein
MTVTVLQAEARTPNSSPRHRPHCALLIAIVVMGAIAVFSLTEHLFIDNLPTAELFSGRWPLVLAAASAGAMLALAGTIMQSVTANPLASPEGLRVSASAAPRRSRTWLLSLAALLTAAATLIVGPMSFVGLIAPHIAAMTTPPKPLNRALCAAAAGAALMTAADWHGRSIHFS